MTLPGAPPGWAPYCGAAPLPGEWLSRWNLDPPLLIGLALLLFAVRRSERRSLGFAAAGLFVFLFVSPFCALTSALFSARVAHHILLTAVVAPLLVLALPSASRWTGSVALWTGLQAITFWLWHAPGLYAQALTSDLIYWAMQASLLGTAAGFWAALRRASIPASVGALLATTVQMGLLGALITFAAAPLYAPHWLTTGAWGLTALEDQQLAGLIMWAPAAGLYLGAALWLAHRWFADETRELAS